MTGTEEALRRAREERLRSGNPFTEEQRRRIGGLVSSGYLPTVERSAKRMTAPIWWDTPDHPSGQPTQGGTVCIVHTGTRLLGITAGHIHEEIARRLDQGLSSWCQLGGHTFDPRERVLEYSETRPDVATYELSEIQVNAADADVHHALAWPPEVSDEDTYVVGGWPWSLSETRPDETTHFFLHFIARLSTSSTTKIGIVTATAASIPWGRNALPAGTNLGGMSGGPIYRMRERNVTIARLELVGIVFQYHVSFEIVYGTPLSLVNADGTIRRDVL